MIPAFPDSSPLEPGLRSEIESVTSKYEPYSDMQFGSLWAWDVGGSTRVSRLNGNLVFLLKDYVDDRRSFSIIGDQQIAETAEQLLDYASTHDIEAQLKLVPESVVNAVRRWPTCLHVELDRSNDDYLISNSEWAILDGHNYAAHRTKVNRFRREHAVEERVLDLCCPRSRREIVGMFDRWAESKPSGEVDRDLERRALIRLFAPVTALKTSGLGLYEQGRMIAFSLWEGTPHAGVSLHHFMKTACDCPGISSYVIHRRAVHLALSGLPVANIEQDLGIPGLAEFKRSLRPIGFLRKHTISFAPVTGPA